MTRQPRSSGASRSVPTIVPALVAVVVVGLLLVLVTRSEGDGDATTVPVTTTTVGDPTSTTVSLEPVALDRLVSRSIDEEPPTTYRIVYDVVENGLPRSEKWTVRRPYESLVVSERDGEQLTGTATSVDALWTYLGDREGWLAVEAQRHRAAFDLRPAPAIGPMLALGLVEEGGTAEHAGAPCRIFVTGQPPGAGRATPPSAAESTELCIDDRGLVLHQRWRLDGETIAERTAASVEVDIEIDPSVFDPTPVVDDADGVAAALTTVAVEADAETLDRLRTEVPVPDGFTADGTVLRAGTPAGSGAGVAEIVRFHSRGPELIEVSEFHFDGPAEVGLPPSVPVEVDGWDEVWFTPDFRASSVQARLTASSYVEVRGVHPGMLFSVLDSIVRVED